MMTHETTNEPMAYVDMTEEQAERYNAMVLGMTELLEGQVINEALSALAQLTACVIAGIVDSRRDDAFLVFATDVKYRIDLIVKQIKMDELLMGEPAGHG